jgi:hypothetical protein
LGIIGIGKHRSGNMNNQEYVKSIGLRERILYEIKDVIANYNYLNMIAGTNGKLSKEDINDFFGYTKKESRLFLLFQIYNVLVKDDSEMQESERVALEHIKSFNKMLQKLVESV